MRESSALGILTMSALSVIFLLCHKNRIDTLVAILITLGEIIQRKLIMVKEVKSNSNVNLSERPNLKAVHLDKVQDFIGFVLEGGAKGSMIKVLFRDAITSDDPRFYIYADAIANSFLNPANIPIDGVHHLLVIIHKDLSADIYANNIPLSVMMRPKRDVAKGEAIFKSDIADIQGLNFPGIEILETDKVFFCFKVGWRFGLYFDVGPREWSKGDMTDSEEASLDVEQMQLGIGNLYRRLSFYDLYKSLEPEASFKRLLESGWFPFIEIMGAEYGTLSNAYAEGIAINDRVNELLDSFDETRLTRIISKWWKQPIFQDKQTIIEAATKAYQQGDEAGFINCIKNLSTEIEGILRIAYRTEIGTGKDIRVPMLIDYVIEKAKTTTGKDSLFLPEYFLVYLRDAVFVNFDGDDQNPKLSRNTSSHGVAQPERYTKARALQLILVLDQIYFYIS